MLRLVLLVVTLMLAACTPVSFTISLGAATATATPTLTPTLSPPTVTATSTPDFAATAQVLASATAQAKATADAQAEATARAQSQATTAAMLAQINATATAQTNTSNATATARANATVIAQANATATALAATAATKTALLAYVDALAQKADNPTRLPDGQLTSSQNMLNTGLRPKNFFVVIEFGNPADPKIHPWDLTFTFRLSSVQNYDFLVLYSNGTWALYYPEQRQADRTMMQRISSGTIPTLNVSPTGSNRVSLVVYENAGFLFVNGELAGTMDLSGNPSSGELWISTGQMIGDNFPGLVMPYKNLAISGLR